MSIFKCKMCGGTIEFNPGDTVGVCDSCGTKQTLPTTNDEIITNLHNRANTLRLKCEFDKAEEIYNKILEKNPDDAEAHWGIILCKYGIEYVEDPKTYNRVPTCHRTSFDAILADEDYKAALANGDGAQRELYEEEAKKIDRIQKDILSIVHNEKPFDVFICYKETDENGNRTQDSVIANDIYHQLTQEGFKVFYAAITLEDKVGQEYEPYIFAALNSAKVMLVVGSKPEYFTAVWVKNEWSRFLKLIKTDRSKLLIPCYRNMDAYELPEEFAHLQAQDMSKIGFINDLVRGIRKVVADTDFQEKTVRESVAVNSGNANEESLLKRAFMFLEDGDWSAADEYCEKVLDIDPENARAYLGKLMAECRVRRMEDLQNCEQPFDGNGNYNKILRFAEPKLAETLKDYNSYIIYKDAVNAMTAADSENEYKAAAEIFKTVPGFKDADDLVEKCLDKAEVCRKDALYNSACSNMTGNIIRNYESAIRKFETISGWKDADEKIYACQKKIEEIKAKEEKSRIASEKASKMCVKILSIIAAIVCVCIVFLLVRQEVVKQQKISEKTEILKSVEVGDTVTFGTYEQDDNISNGKEDIEWLVLAKEENKIFVISDKALDCKLYDTSYTSVTWETCSLRAWLNNDFLNTAFDAAEKKMIMNTKVSADKNPEYDTDPGNETTDKLFLLSISEVTEYFDDDESRKCVPTAYAKARGTYTSNRNKTVSGEETCRWWLRSPGDIQSTVAFINYDGSVYKFGSSAYRNYDDAVRPAMWITIDG